MSRKILVALSSREWADFLPEGEADWLRSQPGLLTLDTQSGDAADKWLRLLREERPEILVACWSTPPLPAALLDEGAFSVRYCCYLAGSVRRLVSRRFIEDGLLVTNWGNAISPSVAECALFLTLSALRGGSLWAVAMHGEGAAWKTPETRNLSLIGRQVGLHGFGAIARALVPMLRPFGVSISTYSPSVPDDLLAQYEVRRARSLEELFSNSQVLIELAPKIPANYRIVDEALLRRLPEQAVFVNVGRGAVVDEAALARVACEGKIFVALDVYEKEPLPAESPLRRMPDVTLLPHLAGPTTDRRRDAGAEGIRNIRAYLEGGELSSVVTLEVYDRAT